MELLSQDWDLLCDVQDKEYGPTLDQGLPGKPKKDKR